jgi:hypothetical protein
MKVIMTTLNSYTNTKSSKEIPRTQEHRATTQKEIEAMLNAINSLLKILKIPTTQSSSNPNKNEPK